MERTERVPHYHSHDGGYGLYPMPNQEPTNLPHFQCCWKVRKSVDTTFILGLADRLKTLAVQSFYLQRAKQRL
jgi:hypothetical protein